LGGNVAGIISLIVVELDGINVFIGHQALLESQTNFFSLLAVYAISRQYYRYKQPPNDNQAVKKIPDLWLWVSAIALALTVTTRLNGVLVGVAITIFLIQAGYWQKVIKLGLIAGGAVLVLWLPFLLGSVLESIRQVVFFQLLREPDGISTNALTLGTITINNP